MDGDVSIDAPTEAAPRSPPEVLPDSGDGHTSVSAAGGNYDTDSQQLPGGDAHDALLNSHVFDEVEYEVTDVLPCGGGGARPRTDRLPLATSWA